MNINTLDDDTPLTVDAPAAAHAGERTATAIRTNIGRMEGALSEFDRVSAGLETLRQRFPIDAVYDVTSTKGMADAVAHRAAWRDPRINVEKFRKAAKSPVLALGKDIDARAAWITEQLLEGEEPIDQQIKAEEQRKREERLAREMRETERVMAIQEAIAGIHMEVMSAGAKSSADMQALLAEMQARKLDPLVYQEMIEQAKAAHAAAIVKLEGAIKGKLWDEQQERERAAERARAEAQRLEDQRIAAANRAEAARLQQLAEEQAAAQKKLADDMAAFQAQQEAARIAALPPEPVIVGAPTHTYEKELPEPVWGPIAFAEAALAATEPAEAPAAPILYEPGRTMKLGEINARIAPLSITARGLHELGFAPASHDRAAVLYRAGSFVAIRAALIRHLQAA